VVVQVQVHGSHIHIYIGMLLADTLCTFGSGDDVHHLDALAAVVLHAVDSSGSAAAGGQHGVNDENIPLCDVLRHLAVIFHRIQGLRITIQADVTDLGSGQHFQHAVHHAQTGTEDGDDGDLLAGQHLAVCHIHWSLYIHITSGQVTGGLIGHETGDLGNDLPKFVGAGMLIPQDAQLMLEQGVVQNMNVITHGFVSPFLSSGRAFYPPPLGAATSLS